MVADMTLRSRVEQQMVRCRALGRWDPSTIIPNNTQHAARVARARSASADRAVHIMRMQAIDVQGLRQVDRQGWLKNSSMEPRPGGSSWAVPAGPPQSFSAGSER